MAELPGGYRPAIDSGGRPVADTLGRLLFVLPEADVTGVPPTEDGQGVRISPLVPLDPAHRHPENSGPVFVNVVKSPGKLAEWQQARAFAPQTTAIVVPSTAPPPGGWQTVTPNPGGGIRMLMAAPGLLVLGATYLATLEVENLGNIAVSFTMDMGGVASPPTVLPAGGVAVLSAALVYSNPANPWWQLTPTAAPQQPYRVRDPRLNIA